PSLGGAAPKLFAWELTEPEKVTLQSFAVSAAPAPTMAREKTMQFTLSAQPNRYIEPVADAVAAVATIAAGATSASFTIATASSVPSDNSPQKIPITTATLKTE